MRHQSPRLSLTPSNLPKRTNLLRPVEAASRSRIHRLATLGLRRSLPQYDLVRRTWGAGCSGTAAVAEDERLEIFARATDLIQASSPLARRSRTRTSESFLPTSTSRNRIAP
jgi:hypothetical protein